MQLIWNPIYMGLASKTDDPLERMKLLAIFSIVMNNKFDEGQCVFNKPV